MPCGTITITQRDLECRDVFGGIEKVYFGEFSSGIWEAPGGTTDGVIDDATAALTIYGFDTSRNVSSLVQTINASTENRTIYFEQTLTLVLPGLDGTDQVELLNLAKGRLVVVVKDVNGNYFVVGNIRGAEVTASEVTSGVAAGDLRGITLTVVAQEQTAAPFLDWDSATDGATGNVTPA